MKKVWGKDGLTVYQRNAKEASENSGYPYAVFLPGESPRTLACPEHDADTLAEAIEFATSY